MPYESVKDVPQSVPAEFRKQWLEVFNSVYAQAKKDGKPEKECEAMAFEQANGVMKKAQKRASETQLPDVLLDQVLAADGAGLVEIPIAVTGKWKGAAREFEITYQDLGSMVANFEKRQNREINVDYDHASEMPEVARGGPVPSAGRIVGLQVGSRQSAMGSGQNGKGALYAGIEFTARALELIRNKEYRYVSPAIDYAARDKLTGESQGTTLTSLALTNRPFLEELPAIRLSEISVAAMSSSSPKPATAGTPPLQLEGGKPMELNTKLIGKGKIEIFGDGKTLGFVDLPSPESLPDRQAGPVPSPEESFALFTERLGAKGKTEVEIKQLVESGVKFTGREAQDAAFKLLASECVKDGKLDREKMKVLARDQKASVEQFFTFEDAWGKVDTAVKAGKVLPKSREHALRIALSDAPAFDALMADAKAIVPLGATGLAGAGATPATVAFNEAAGVKVNEHSLQVLNRIQGLMKENSKVTFEEAAAQARKELGDEPAAA